MTITELPIEGGCRCGRVRFRLSESPLMEMACHCRGCQRMTASAFSTTPVASPEVVNVRATLLDDADWFAPWPETQTAGMLPWAQTGAERRASSGSPR